MKTETHGDHEAHKHAAAQSIGHARTVNGMRSPDQPTDAKPFTDPVCGMKVGPNPEREISFEGEVYHFCSAKCMVKFKAAPHSYLAPANAAEVRLQEAPAGTVISVPCILRFDSQFLEIARFAAWR